MRSNGVAIVFRLEDVGDYFAVKRRILKWVRRRTVSSGSRIRAGTILPAPSETLQVSYSQHAQDVGRRRMSWSTQVPLGRHHAWASELLSSAKFLARTVEFDRLIMQPSSLDCISVSGLAESDLTRLSKLRWLRAFSVALVQIDPSNRIQRYFLWDRLGLTALISRNRLLESLPDVPENFSEQPDGSLSFSVPDYLRVSNPRTRFFYEDDIFGGMYIDDRVVSFSVPVEWASSPDTAEIAGMVRTPVAHAIHSMKSQTGSRISLQDDADSLAKFELPEWERQFPDFDQVLSRVEGYCLNVAHVSAKHDGFRTAGYELVRSGDSLALASHLVSALLGQFPVTDSHPTADGALLFSVPILIPGFNGATTRVTTAWNLGTAGLSLSTAFVGSGATEFASSVRVGVDRESKFSDINYCISTVPKEFGLSVVTDRLFVSGWLWISHVDERSAAFALWCRNQPSLMTRVFYRARLGGRVTSLRIPGAESFVGAAQAIGTLRMAQAILARCGIRAFVEVVYD